MIHFIGFNSLAAFHASLLPEPAPYLILTRLTHTADTATSSGRYTYRLVASQIQGDRVHYWMTDVASADFWGGHVTEEHADRVESARSAHEAVSAFFLAQNLHPIEALIAMPADFRLLEGDLDPISYDKAFRRFSFDPAKLQPFQP